MKRKSDVSHSVAVADLRKKRRRRADVPVSLSQQLTADAPSVSQNITEVEKQFPGEIDKDLFFQFYGHPKKLSLEQGQFLLRRLQELEFKLSDYETPKDGSCLFHGLLDQMSQNLDLQDEASSHLELRWKIVNFGYEYFLKTRKLGWTHEETPEEWRKMMSSPDDFGQYAWGDDVALQLAANGLGVDIAIIPAFKESAGHRDPGITIIRSIQKPKHAPLYLFYYSESDFSNPHFQSIFPRSQDNVVKIFIAQNDDRVSLSLSLTHSA